jgi:leucyl-tRNA---protein transferase
MTSLKDIRLFTTQSHACSYLPHEQAQTLFIDPEFKVDQAYNTRLSEIGFRRSGSHVYRPNCKNCQQCVSCRVLVRSFIPGPRYKRVLKRNADLVVSQVDDIAGDEYYLLYKHYISVRHDDGDMYPATREQYGSFLMNQCEGTRYYEIRRQSGQLLGLMVSDRLDNALSAVYTFYDPLEEKRSLGTFAILWQIAEARRLGLSYLYLGYWIRDSRKMRYKTEYRPLEMLVRQRWVLST